MSRRGSDSCMKTGQVEAEAWKVAMVLVGEAK